MATATYTRPQQSKTDPEALKRSLPLPTAADIALDATPRVLNRRMEAIPEDMDWSPPSTPELSASASSSRHNSLPSTPLLTPSVPCLPFTPYPLEDKQATDYFGEHEHHHGLRAKLVAWGANHLHALEAFVAQDEEGSTCVPAPRVVPENARIEPASTGAQVRFLVRPMPPKHEAPKPQTKSSYTQRLSPILAAVACALLGYGDAEDFLGDEAYEFAEDGFDLEL